MNLPKFSHKYESLEEMSPEELSPEEEKVLENNEISIHYMNMGEILDKNKVIVDYVFHLKLLLTLLEVMVKTLPEVMNKVNHKLSKNVDVEMIG